MKKTGKLLIVDDNRELLSALKLCLSPYFETIDLIYDPNRLLSILRDRHFDLILLDMNFSPGRTTGNEGIYWLGRIKETDPAVGVVLITAYGDIPLAVRTMREGAIDFILKSWDENKIVSAVLAAMKIQESQRQIRTLKAKGQQLKSDIDDRHKLYYGTSPAMQKVKQMVHKVAATEANVLILGENGTGKELIAREIHRLSQRSDDIFVKIDLGAVSESLFESELYGYRKGAFTDAKDDKPGRLEVASGGTVFLDEIGNLSLDMQTKLLSVLQNREIVRLGDTRPLAIDIRLVSATNADLYKEVEHMRFREDLFYRLNTIIIDLPPLRSRKEDIPLLADMFLQELNGDYNKNVKFSAEVYNYLPRLNWPGNIRELRHLVEKGVILAENNIMAVEDIKLASSRSDKNSIRSFRLDVNEKQIIESALDSFEWNISRAAKELGINRSTLYEKITKYEISKN
ncbi:MAG: sigma-54 dependent transcriptional regulator [Marinilabiliaceae bacterium]|nr:sigma-54 dependent transcriptional regulator [Marinilabiliaceae bacterium]